MKENYLEIVDKVVMIAYKDGYCIPKEEIWGIYAVKYRLNAYGDIGSEGRYFLNEKGMEYAISGCSKGIKERFERQEEIERLDIQTKTFTRNKQSRLYWFSKISFVLSILAFFGGFEALQDLLSWLLGLIESLCNS